KGAVTGVLMLLHHNPEFYNQHHADLAVAFAQQAAVAIENAHLYEEARDKAALEERNRLARELHDSVTQALYGVTLNAEAAKRHLAEGDLASVRAELEELRS